MEPPWTALALVTAVFALSDTGSELAGGSSIPGGPLDELAHLSTAIIVIWALRLRASQRLLAAALVASVAIDIDHVPSRLGVDWITTGTPRPYIHSLLTVGVVLSAALLWRRRRDVLLGIALGLAVHFWRDLAESGSGVSLLWPWSYRSFSLPHGSYLAVVAGFVVLAGWRCRQAAGRSPASNRSPRHPGLSGHGRQIDRRCREPGDV